MSVTLATAAAELGLMRLNNGVDRTAAAIGSLVQGVETRVPYGREIVGAAEACLLVPLAVASLIERASGQDY